MRGENYNRFIKFFVRRRAKFLFSFALSVSFASTCAAQAERETCALTLSDAPVLFTLRLRMTPAEVKTVFGKSLKLKVKREGTFFQNFIDKKPPAFLPDVRALYLRFFDGRLYQIEIFYGETKRETAQIEAPTAFVSRLSSNLNLPEASFQTAKDERFYKLFCNGFSLAIDEVLNPRVELTDEEARARFEESRKKKI